MNDFLKYTIWFVTLVLLQVFVFDNIQFNNYLTPNVYILLILILPLQMHPSQVLLVAFALGLSVDIVSSGIIGAHAAACVACAYWRKTLIRFILPKGEYDNLTNIASRQMGLSKFIIYTLLIVFVHHTILFFIEIFSFAQIFTTLLRIIVSTVVSSIFIVLFQHLFSTQSSK